MISCPTGRPCSVIHICPQGKQMLISVKTLDLHSASLMACPYRKKKFCRDFLFEYRPIVEVIDFSADTLSYLSAAWAIIPQVIDSKSWQLEPWKLFLHFLRAVSGGWRGSVLSNAHIYEGCRR